MRLAAVSVDLDEIHHYYEIHGLLQHGAPPQTPPRFAHSQRTRAPLRGAGTPAPFAGGLNLVYDVAIDRLRALADVGGFPLTLFAIGRDLARDASRDRLRVAAEDGHEIANHSLDHRYDLVRLGRDEIERQIEQGADAIEAACGKRPVGFRAPGYTITDEVFEVLRNLEVEYDASVFPCPAYWIAKAAAIKLIGLRGRKSQSIVDTPSVLRAPTVPYRVGSPYWRRGDGVLEIPVQVTHGPRLPFIGTSVTMAGPTRARWLTRMCIGEPLVNLELHGIDVLDESDGLEALRAHQVDVKIPKERKTAAVLAVVDELKRAGYTFVTMREAAASFGSQ